jgi:hypothetical protein
VVVAPAAGGGAPCVDDEGEAPRHLCRHRYGSPHSTPVAVRCPVGAVCRYVAFVYIPRLSGSKVPKWCLLEEGRQIMQRVRSWICLHL